MNRKRKKSKSKRTGYFKVDVDETLGEQEFQEKFLETITRQLMVDWVQANLCEDDDTPMKLSGATKDKKYKIIRPMTFSFLSKT